MKKLIFWGAAALLAAVSCNKELENTTPVLPEGDRVSFVATVDGAETKTVMGDIDNNTVASYWNGNERIWVLDPRVEDEVLNEGWKKAFAGTATMADKITFTEESQESSLVGDYYYAVYPAGEASDNATWNGEAEAVMNNVRLNGVQTPVKGSYDAQNHIAVAYTEKGNNNLTFKNVVSFVKVTVGNDNVSSVCVYNNDVNNAMSGVFTVSYNDGNPQVSNKAEANNYAKVEGTINNGSTYYIAVLPGTYDGFTLEYVIAGDKYSKTLKNAITIERNKVIDLGEVSFEVNAIEYTDVYMKPSTQWLADNAGFAAYTWNASTNAWFSLIDSDSDGVFEAEIPNTFENVIFCRIKSGASNGWSNALAQTGDLTMPTDDNNAYIVYNNTWTTLADAKAFTEPVINAKDGCVYLLPNSNWTQSNAWFAIYLCNGSNDATWIKMTKIEGTAYYEAELPDGFDATKYANIIFCRMNPASQTLDWSNKWNQSGDLDSNQIVTGKNCCAINDGQWDCGSNVTWSTVNRLN